MKNTRSLDGSWCELLLARQIEAMREPNSAEGTTFTFSTHDQRLLDQVKRLVRLEDGRIVGEEVRA